MVSYTEIGGGSGPCFSSVVNAQFYQVSMEGAFMNSIRSTRSRIFLRSRDRYIETLLGV
jgi:hypothetical protein